MVITLIVVSDHAEERQVLASFDRWATRVAGPFAPVLDVDDLPVRMVRALNHAGCDVRMVDAHDDGAAPPTAAVDSTRPATPSLVLAGSAVDPAVVELAARMCRTAARPLSDVEAATRALGHQPRSALVLVDPEQTRAAELVDVLGALAHAHVEVGIIHAAHPIETRYAILKSLLVAELQGRGEFAILSPYAETQGRCTPAQLQNTARGPTTFTHRRDLLILVGHANPIDANLGAELVLCGRLGAGPVAGDDRQSSFPCDPNNECFRQPLFGRGPRDTTGLVRIAEADARVLVLSGCSVGAFGRAWFAARRGLAAQSHQGPALAAVISTANVTLRIDLDFLFPALLAAGYTLGRAVHAINAVRGSELRHASSAPGIGPFVVLGNPCMRMTGIALHDLIATRSAQDRLTVQLGAARVHANQGALIRVADLALPPTAYLETTEPASERFCLGSVIREDGATTLYLWLAATGAGWPDELELALHDRDPSESFVAAIAHSLSQLAFWLVYLDEYACMFRAAPATADQLRRVLAALPATANLLSKATNAVRYHSDAITNGASLRPLQDAVWGRLRAMTAWFLDAALEVVALFGTVHAYGWESRFLRLQPTGPLDDCTCGGSVRYGQRYGFPGADRLERVQYQCAACGPVGEDDGRRLLDVRDVPLRIPARAVLACTGQLRAPASERVHIQAVAVIEAWRKDRRMFGTPRELDVAAGQQASFALSVDVPADLSPGVYPFAIVAVINGALAIRRCFVEVERSLTSTSCAAP